MSRLPRVTAREVIAALRRAGFIETVASGGHRQSRRGTGGGRVTVPMHGDTLEIGLLHSILQQPGLTGEEFIALL
jgi:predicted RNA binding protein YcfA (HicA-like mRNA interferase family)